MRRSTLAINFFSFGGSSSDKNVPGGSRDYDNLRKGSGGFIDKLTRKAMQFKADLDAEAKNPSLSKPREMTMRGRSLKSYGPGKDIDINNPEDVDLLFGGAKMNHKKNVGPIDLGILEAREIYLKNKAAYEASKPPVAPPVNPYDIPNSFHESPHASPASYSSSSSHHDPSNRSPPSSRESPPTTTATSKQNKWRKNFKNSSSSSKRTSTTTTTISSGRDELARRKRESHHPHQSLSPEEDTYWGTSSVREWLEKTGQARPLFSFSSPKYAWPAEERQTLKERLREEEIQREDRNMKNPPKPDVRAYDKDGRLFRDTAKMKEKESDKEGVGRGSNSHYNNNNPFQEDASKSSYSKEAQGFKINRPSSSNSSSYPQHHEPQQQQATSSASYSGPDLSTHLGQMQAIGSAVASAWFPSAATPTSSSSSSSSSSSGSGGASSDKSSSSPHSSSSKQPSSDRRAMDPFGRPLKDPEDPDSGPTFAAAFFSGDGFFGQMLKHCTIGHAHTVAREMNIIIKDIDFVTDPADGRSVKVLIQASGSGATPLQIEELGRRVQQECPLARFQEHMIGKHHPKEERMSWELLAPSSPS